MKIMMIMVIAILTSSCTNFAMLSSGATISISQNVYAKAYSGIDVLTIIQTDKDIKTHVYDRLTEHPSSDGSNPGGYYPPQGCVSAREKNESN